jgi:hypothetical protein
VNGMDCCSPLSVRDMWVRRRMKVNDGLEISFRNTSENGVIMTDGLDNSCLLLITADNRE